MGILAEAIIAAELESIMKDGSAATSTSRRQTQCLRLDDTLTGQLRLFNTATSNSEMQAGAQPKSDDETIDPKDIGEPWESWIGNDSPELPWPDEMAADAADHAMLRSIPDDKPQPKKSALDEILDERVAQGLVVTEHGFRNFLP